LTGLSLSGNLFSGEVVLAEKLIRSEASPNGLRIAGLGWCGK